MTKHKNVEGYHDPTAGKALDVLDIEQARITKLVNVIKKIAELVDFEIAERIVFIDKKNGKEMEIKL